MPKRARSGSEPPPIKQNFAQVVPFLVLNHRLDAKSLRRRVAECAATGADGFIIHPREGLLTPYLSETWFEAISACVDEARRRGIKAWIFDEFPYPSGVAGGLVVQSDPRFAERHLRVERHRIDGGGRRLVVLGSNHVLHAFLLPIHDGKANSRAARDVTAQVGPFNDDWIVRPWDSRYYYATKYAQLYDCPRSQASRPQAVFEADVPPGQWELTLFIARTGGDFVEPFGHYVDVSKREATEKFIEITHEEYRKRFGREFGKTIAGFFTDEPKYRNPLPWSDSIAREWPDYQRDPQALLALAGTNPDRVEERMRFNYRQTAFRLFRKNWVNPISKWCSNHRLQLTGHISPEERWGQEAAHCGSVLQLLKSFHVPGCDLIIPAVGDREHPILNFTPSLAVSAAAQKGCRQALCELYGASNYQINMQDMKRIAEWLALFGINVFTVHGLFGSIAGYRKYDAPPTFCPPSTLWPHFKNWVAHIKRTAQRLGPRGARPNFVIVRPMRTLWRMGMAGEVRTEKIYERAMKLALHLLERGFMIHWMDDIDLEGARVRDGKVCVGRASYPMLVHLSGTLDPEATVAIATLKKQRARVLTDSEAMKLQGPLQSEKGAIRVVETKDGHWFGLNLSPKRQIFGFRGSRCEFEGYESRWMKQAGKESPKKEAVRTVSLARTWTIRPQSDNLVVLKQWTLNGRPTSLAPYYDVAPPEEIGALEPVSLGQIPIRPELKEEKRLVYRTQFQVKDVRSIALVCESDSIRGRWIAQLNGRPLKVWKRTNRYDPSNLEADLRPHVRDGLNRLEFAVVIDKSTDGMIDSCRLFGQFRVNFARHLPVLTPGVEVNGAGDWTKLGFPHYSGTMICAQTFRWEKRAGETVALRLERPPGDQLVAHLNGQRVGELLWSPWELDITRAVHSGENRLELRVSNTLDNFIYGRPRPSGLNGGVKIEARKASPADSTA